MASMLHSTSGRSARRPVRGAFPLMGMAAPSSARDGGRARMLVPSSGRAGRLPRARMMAPSSGRDSTTIHNGIWCDGCSQYPLVGVRMTCTRCDLDYCSACFRRRRHAHRMERVRARQYGVGPFTTDKLSADMETFAETVFLEKPRIFARKRSDGVEAEAARLSVIYRAPETDCSASLKFVGARPRASVKYTLLCEVNGVRWHRGDYSGLAHSCGLVTLTVQFVFEYSRGIAELRFSGADADCAEVEVAVVSPDDDMPVDDKEAVERFMRDSVWKAALRFAAGLFELHKDEVEDAVQLPAMVST